MQQQSSGSLDNIKPLLEERGKLTKQKKDIEDRIKQLDKDLRPVLVGRGAVIHGGFQFEVSETAGRITYDTKAAIADGVDLEPYKKQGAPSTRFNVKEVQQL